METFTSEALEMLKYPIGKFHAQPVYSKEEHLLQIADIEAFPHSIEKEVVDLADVQLDTAYRPGGWTIRQVVHHCADSHMNAFFRFKLALTEENPVIKPYNEKLWAQLPDANLPVEVSLQLIRNIHIKWVHILKNLNCVQLELTYYHPESKRNINLYEATALYAWHSNHHLAHIKNLKSSKNW